jgi:hypothetical protein
MYKGIRTKFSTFWALKKAIWTKLLTWFSIGEWPYELIICLENDLKCDFGDADEALFHDVEKTFDRIFYILGIQKSVLDDVAEMIF